MKKTSTPPKARAKKVAVKQVAKKTPRKPAVKAAVKSSNKVDYYPNRMTVAISALAGTLLVLLALIAVLGSK